MRLPNFRTGAEIGNLKRGYAVKDIDKGKTGSGGYSAIPAYVRTELDKFEEDIAKYRAGKTGEIKFQKIRLQMGTYAQRQPGYQMQRIKIPYGGITAGQLRRIADAAEKYGDSLLHITTRQDIQLYYIKLENVPKYMRELAEVGITTREACGNTIRNVTACPRSGTALDEIFDVTPYADAFFQFMLRNRICQNMGRKFKVAFEGCPNQDHAGVRIHDLGWWARVKTVDGKPKRGFQLYVGGGLGSAPRLGDLWPEFVPEEEMLPLSAAIIRIFDRYGERKSRMQARMKFLIKKLGFPKFQERVEAERKILKIGPEWNDFLKTVNAPPVIPVLKKEFPPAPAGTEKDPDFLAWKADSVLTHRLPEWTAVHIRIPLGDLYSPKAREVAALADIYSGGLMRTSIQQNLVFPWVLTKAVSSLYAALKKIDLAASGANRFVDVTACPGADTCRLGVTSAKGLATAISESVTNGLGKYKDLIKDLRVKISGCPNSCAQHHVANIGFHGVTMSKDGKNVPAHFLYVGGGMLGENSRIGVLAARIPARNAPKAVEKLVALYARERKGSEHFDEVMQRLGNARLKEELAELTEIPSFADDPKFYQDWGQEETFEMRDNVKGECAGATVEERVPTLVDAEQKLAQAKAFFSHKEFGPAMVEAYEAAAAAVRVPVYDKLADPFTPEQTLWEFENILARSGEADKRWIDITDRLSALRASEPMEASAREMIDIAAGLYEESARIHQILASSKNS